MASTNEKVMNYVERELSKQPDVSNEVLFEGAKKIDASVGELTLRQFHAKYPLQVKRRRGKSAKSAKSRKKTTTKKAKKTTRARKTKRSTRAKAGGRRTSGRSRAASGAGARSAEGAEVRRVMMRFARDLSAAESQLDTIDVLADLDRYVSDILKASRG